MVALANWKLYTTFGAILGVRKSTEAPIESRFILRLAGSK